jgi:hypothetical protein
LPAEILEPLELWWDNMHNEPPQDLYLPRGLWVTGPSGCGTSYVAKRAMRRAENDAWWDGGISWPSLNRMDNVVSASRLMAKVRDMWTLQSNTRQSDDVDAWQAYDQIVTQVEWWLDTAPVSFIDNLHASYDAAFWTKHIGNRLEDKIKEGKGVIIASEMSPVDVVGGKWPNLFVVCEMEEDSLAER